MNKSRRDLIANTKSPRLGVAIVTFNGEAWIEKCLDSIRNSTHPAYVAVFDNASSDGTPRAVLQNYPEVAFLQSDKNLGFGVGNNAAIAHLMAQGCEYILLLNQDAFLLPDTTQRLISFMDEHRDVDVVTPLHCSPDDQHIDRKTFMNYLARHASTFINDAIMGQQQPFYRIRGVNAAIWMVRSHVFRRIGGFDPLFFMYGEDDDLIARMADHSIVFALTPNIKAVHLRQSPPTTQPRTFLAKVKKRATREQSSLLMLVKRPAYTQGFRLKLLFASGILEAIADWLSDSDAVELIARLLATYRVLVDLNRVRRHADLLTSAGPHFIDSAVPSGNEWRKPTLCVD